jgi:hypothetical protein
MRRNPPKVTLPAERVLGDWVEEDAVAAEFGFSRATNRHHLDQAGVGFRFIGSRRFYRRSDIAAFMEGVRPSRQRHRRANQRHPGRAESGRTA